METLPLDVLYYLVNTFITNVYDIASLAQTCSMMRTHFRFCQAVVDKRKVYAERKMLALASSGTVEDIELCIFHGARNYCQCLRRCVADGAEKKRTYLFYHQYKMLLESVMCTAIKQNNRGMIDLLISDGMCSWDVYLLLATMHSNIDLMILFKSKGGNITHNYNN